MDRLAGIHAALPYVLSIATGAVFGLFGLYTLSGAGDLRRLPFIMPAVVIIMWIYFVRAVGGSGLGGFIEDTSVKEVVFSTIALAMGTLYAVGARALYHQV